MALCAKFKFETEVFFMILRSKIMKNTSVSKENSAAAGGKRLLTQPQNGYQYIIIIFFGAERIFEEHYFSGIVSFL